MASAVEICNMALAIVRGGSINNLDQTSVQAQNCKLFYPICRDMILEEVPWGFGRKISPLALLTDEVFNWAFVYQYPTDCHTINKIVADLELVASDASSAVAVRAYDAMYARLAALPPAEYMVMNVDGNKVIVCNEANARIDYRSKVTDPNLFPPTFQLALANLIATFIAIPIAGEKEGSAMKSQAEQMYVYLMKQAQAKNTNERVQNQAESEFITIRN